METKELAQLPEEAVSAAIAFGTSVGEGLLEVLEKNPAAFADALTGLVAGLFANQLQFLIAFEHLGIEIVPCVPVAVEVPQEDEEGQEGEQLKMPVVPVSEL